MKKLNNKWVWMIVGLAVLVGLYFFLNSPFLKKNQGDEGKDKKPPAGESGPLAAILLKDGVVEIGTALMTTAKPLVWRLLPGQKSMLSPIRNVAFDHYVNGKVIHIGTHDPSKNDIPVFDGDITEIGFRLKEGQGISEIPVAYVIYRGKAPPPNWYEAACQVTHIASK